MNTSRTNQSIISAVLVLAASLLLAPAANGAVTAVTVVLTSDSTGYRYVVPAGKVLILEHVAFCDTWTGKTKALRILASINPVGPAWTTTITYNYGWNSLLRPIRIPAGKAAAIDLSYGSGFLCFLYGLLVDQEDLYAEIPATVSGPQVTSTVAEQRVTGQIALQSPRPARVVVDQTEDLAQWTKADNSVQGTLSSPAQKTFTASVSAATPQAFFKAHGQAGDNLLPPLSPDIGSAITVEDLPRVTSP